MNYIRLTSWIGLAGVAVALAGCPGGDDTATTDNTTPGTTTNTPGTTTDDPGTTTDDPGTTTDTPVTTTDDPNTTTMSVDSSTGPGMMSSSGMPAECGTNVSTGNDACDACLFAGCCDQVQACWGDETVMMNTPCLELNNCLVMNCMEAMTPPEIQKCGEAMCADFIEEFDAWGAFAMCQFTTCGAECAPE